MSPGELIRSRRLAHGLTQTQLARRAGTTQAAISRLERDELSPSLARIADLLLVLGEEPELSARRIPSGHDPRHLADMRARSPEERLALAASWNNFAGGVALAGERARRARP